MEMEFMGELGRSLDSAALGETGLKPTTPEGGMVLV